VAGTLQPADALAMFASAGGQFVYVGVADSGMSGAPIAQATGPLQARGGDEYDAAFVASIQQADAAPPEASFNNVVDMLDWLNRD
jgi:predicted kinase